MVASFFAKKKTPEGVRDGKPFRLRENGQSHTRTLSRGENNHAPWRNHIWAMSTLCDEARRNENGRLFGSREIRNLTKLHIKPIETSDCAPHDFRACAPSDNAAETIKKIKLNFN